MNCWTVDVMKDALAAVDWSSQEAPALPFVQLFRLFISMAVITASAEHLQNEQARLKH